VVDDPDTSELLKPSSGPRGEVRVAGSARGVEMLDRWIPDVLVSDIGAGGTAIP
jgi:hypothetical protein